MTVLEDEIARFDAVLDRIQKLMPQDMKVYDRVVEARDAVFRLQQKMQGCEIIEFCAPWIDPDQIGFTYEHPATGPEGIPTLKLLDEIGSGATYTHPKRHIQKQKGQD